MTNDMTNEVLFPRKAGSMRRQIRKVAVLGSGVMGSAIAAHFANAGIPSLVLDIVPRELTAQQKAGGLSCVQRFRTHRINPP